jgi:hypothetical protein
MCKERQPQETDAREDPPCASARLAAVLLYTDPSMPRLSLVPLLLVIVVFAVAVHAEATPAPILCRTTRVAKVGGVSAFRPYTRLRLRDRLTAGGRVIDVRKPAEVCMPSSIDGAAIDAAATPRTGYATHVTRLKPAQPRFAGGTVDVQAPWGVEQLKVVASNDLLVPAASVPDPSDAGPAAGLDALACYTVKTGRAAPSRTVMLSGATMPAAVAVTRPVRLCVPSDVADETPSAIGDTAAWLCLTARLPKTASLRVDDAKDDVLIFRDRFGRVAMKLGAPSELCVPATIGAPVAAPTATPTPQPTASPSPGGPRVVAIRVEPPHVVRRIGESYAYTAIATLSDGTERNATEDVVWTCDFSCDAPNTPGDRGRVEAHSWGYTPPFDYYGDVYATDPQSGVASPYVTFEVSSGPIALVIYPDYTVIREHTFDYLTALALDDQGAYRNATQDVVWSSTDPNIALVTNTDGVRSRVDGVAPGISTIHAIDPRNGAVSNDAKFDVFGPLQRIDVYARGRSILNTKETIDVGETISVTAWAYFERGFHFEGFEPLTFTSSHDDVAAIEQLPDPLSYMPPNGVHRRVIRGLVPGATRISARDDLTGFSTSDVGCETRVTVRQPVSSLRLNPPARTAGLDETVKLTALGVGSDAATRNFTQRVVYTSSNPSVAIATNETGDRSKIVTVGPGTTVISAVDPTTGLATTISGGDTTLTVRDERVDRIAVSPIATHVPPGAFPRFRAVGHYPSGATATITESVTFSSSMPEVASSGYFGGGSRFYTFGEGSTVVSATMASLGIGSTASGGDATLFVERVVGVKVLPENATIAVGDEQAFHVVATLASGTELELGTSADFGDGYVVLTSGDPDVARATDACEAHAGDLFSPLSPVIGRASGMSTISARWGSDLALTSTATGGDATITVTP